MDKFELLQFKALIKREVLEHRNLFFYAPAVLALVILVLNSLTLAGLGEENRRLVIEFIADRFSGSSPFDMAPMFFIAATPFIHVLYLCGLLYLTNSLYQDRRELSILFWQSMPVSNLKTVLSKVVTIAAVAPLFYLAILFGLYLVGIIWLTLAGVQYNVEVAGLANLLAAVVVSLFIVYFYMLAMTLWLLPLVGWLLLFSAFAKRTPLLWAIGVFFLMIFVEFYFFGSQYLANWVGTRIDIDNYLLIDFVSIFNKLMSYDMLIGIVIGSILISGAVYMRRFID